MSNLNRENFQISKQSVNLTYQAVIIVLHWLGCSLFELEKLLEITATGVNHLLLPYKVKFVFLQAPNIEVSLDNDWHPGSKMEPAWYNINSEEDLEEGEDDRGMIESIEWVEEIIKKEIDKGILSRNIFIFGISQGGSMALAIAMSSQYELGGFISVVGFIPYPKVIKRIKNEKNKQTPIFMVNSEEDERIPYEKAQKSEQILKEDGYKIEPLKKLSKLNHENSIFISPMSLIFFQEIFQKKNLPKLGYFNRENFVIIEKYENEQK